MASEVLSSISCENVCGCAKDIRCSSRSTLPMADCGGLPISPHDALKKYGHHLSAHEHKEIKQYPQVWYLGISAEKVIGYNKSSPNSGFDDISGRYNFKLHDHIAFRYEIKEANGKGIAGQVFKCLDHKINKPVAIKMIRNRRRAHLQALVEVKLLNKLKKLDCHRHNIIEIIDYFYFRNHLCITFEFMGMTLREFLQHNNFQGLSTTHIRKYARELLQCLNLLHHAHIIHCDLKPENIMLSLEGKNNIKVIDFGSSCYEHEKVYTYVQSRFYRSPEVILGLPYSTSIDMWSFGVILAELHNGRPLFPGENEVDQLALIMEVLGQPSQSLLRRATKADEFFDSDGNPRCNKDSSSHKRPGTKELSAVLKTDDNMFLDLLHKCLVFDPSQRITPKEALQHKWILEGKSACSALNESSCAPEGDPQSNKNTINN